MTNPFPFSVWPSDLGKPCDSDYCDEPTVAGAGSDLLCAECTANTFDLYRDMYLSNGEEELEQMGYSPTLEMGQRWLDIFAPNTDPEAARLFVTLADGHDNTASMTDLLNAAMAACR